MKKYLIKGLLALFVGGFTASCADDVDYIPLAQQKTKAYNEAFKELIGGDVDPGQKWGFEGLTISEIEGNGRANTRNASPDANMWGSDWEVPAPLTAAQKDKVRRYFQQNKNPQGIAIDYTNFFVQDVYKGGTNLEGSLTTEKYTAGNGDVITGSEKMNKLTAGSDNDHISNYNNAQCSTNGQVWDGTLTNPNDPNSKVFHSDQIMLMTNSKTDCFGFSNSLQSGNQYNKNYVIISGDEIMKWDSSADADVSGMYFVGFDYDANFDNGFTEKGNPNSYLVTESNENNPDAFEVPNKNDGKLYVAGAADGYYSDWIVKITEAKKQGGNGGGGGGTVTTSKMVKQQWRYKKLVSQGRVFCEDLGTAGLKDLDFNDIVFDARIWAVQDYVTTTVDDGEPIYSDWTNWKYEVDLCFLAAGGTIPAKVLGSDVHAQFNPNIGQTTMINTVDDNSGTLTYWENQSTTVEPKTYNGLDITDLINSLTAADSNHEITPADITISVLWADSEDPAKFGTSMHTVGELHAEQGDVPHMFCVPIGTRWAAEHRAITEAYPSFDEWSKNAAAAPDFYEIVNEDALYTGNATGLPMRDNNGQEYTIGYQFWTPVGQPEITETEIHTPAADSIILWEGEYTMGDKGECNLGVYSDWANLQQGGKVSIYGIVNDGDNAKIWVRDAWWAKDFIGTEKDYADFNGYIEFTLAYGNDNIYFGKDGCSIIVLGKNFTLTKVVYTAPGQ